MKQTFTIEDNSLTSIQTYALLVGFPNDEVAATSLVFQRMGWRLIGLHEETEILSVVTRQQMDIIIVDVENSNTSATLLIEEVRLSSCRSNNATIVAIADNCHEGLRRQLKQAGADLVVGRGTAPMYFFTDLMRAAISRLRNSFTEMHGKYV